MQRQTPESRALAAICDYLAVRGYVFWRQNNAGIYDVRNQRFRAMPTYSARGVSDIIVLVGGMAWFLEVKSDKGRQSPDQKDFEEMVTRAGCRYEVVRSIDDLQALGF